jgi:hypothetical protein
MKWLALGAALLLGATAVAFYSLVQDPALAAVALGAAAWCSFRSALHAPAPRA